VGTIMGNYRFDNLKEKPVLVTNSLHGKHSIRDNVKERSEHSVNGI